MRSLVLCALIGIASNAFGAIYNATDSGWYDATGFHTPSNLNYFTGQLSGGEYRSFFVFDFTALTTATSATLTINNRGAGASTGAPFVLNLFPVTTATATVTGGGGVPVFTDLGNGTVLGAFTVSTNTAGDVVINLNASGISYLNGLAGGSGVLGMAFAFSGAPDTADHWAFANENFGQFTNSTIRLDVTEVGPVPEPAGVVTVLTGAALLALMRRRRA